MHPRLVNSSSSHQLHTAHSPPEIPVAAGTPPSRRHSVVSPPPISRAGTPGRRVARFAFPSSSGFQRRDSDASPASHRSRGQIQSRRRGRLSRTRAAPGPQQAALPAAAATGGPACRSRTRCCLSQKDQGSDFYCARARHRARRPDAGGPLLLGPSPATCLNAHRHRPHASK